MGDEADVLGDGEELVERGRLIGELGELSSGGRR